jgi:DNA-binding PadR family transcriptional regulator
MSAKHAVLGLVIERPGYGYDLARRLRERFGSSGFAPTGVYSALDQLSAEGLVRSAGRSADGAAERAAPRTVYEATDAGVEHFDRWMRSDSPPAHVRDELNMKLALSRPRDLAGLLELACAQERECLERLEALKRAPAHQGRASERRRGLAWEEVATLLVRDAETRQLQARIEWLQRTRAIIAKVAPPAHDGAGRLAGDRAGAAQSAGGGVSEHAPAPTEARVA